jgi:hypothetical protein
MLVIPRAHPLAQKQKSRRLRANPLFAGVCTSHLPPAVLHLSRVVFGIRANAPGPFVDKPGSGGHNEKASLER